MATRAETITPTGATATSNRRVPTRDSTDLPTPSRPARSIVPTALIIALTLLNAGCLGETTCRELGCPDNQTCNRETGECEPLQQACTVGSCPSGEVCDPSSGQCQPELPTCADGESCPEGLECNVETETCEANPGCTPGECASPAEECNPGTERCEPTTCEVDSDCPAGFICGDEVCRAGCRAATNRCPPDRFCSSQSPDEIGQCVPECRTNQSCPHGQICVEQDGLRTCQPEGPCSEDTDCRDDEVCINARCVAPPCADDSDCSEPRRCQTATGLCVGGDCQDDPLSPNHSIETAAELQLNTYTGLTLCPARDDWYTFQASSSQALTFDLEYNGAVDLDLFVYDDSGRLIGQNRRPAPGTESTSDQVELIATRSQQLTIRVLAHGQPPGAESVPYSLGIRTDDARFCRDDNEEENDTIDEATQISGNEGVPTDVSFQICGRDRDVFELSNLDPSNGLEVSLRNAASHIRLETFTDRMRSRFLKPGQSHKWLRVGDSEPWYFRVASALGRSSGYTFRFQVTPAWNCPDAGAHDDAASALPIDPDTTNTSTFCPVDGGWEVDWISADTAPQANSLLTATVRPNAEMPEVTVALFRRTDGGDISYVRAATRTQQGLTLAAPFDPTDTPLIRVSSSETPGRIDAEPTYEVEYDYELP